MGYETLAAVGAALKQVPQAQQSVASAVSRDRQEKRATQQFGWEKKRFAREEDKWQIEKDAFKRQVKALENNKNAIKDTHKELTNFFTKDELRSYGLDPKMWGNTVQDRKDYYAMSQYLRKQQAEANKYAPKGVFLPVDPTLDRDTYEKKKQEAIQNARETQGKKHIGQTFSSESKKRAGKPYTQRQFMETLGGSEKGAEAMQAAGKGAIDSYRKSLPTEEDLAKRKLRESRQAAMQEYKKARAEGLSYDRAVRLLGIFRNVENRTEDTVWDPLTMEWKENPAKAQNEEIINQLTKIVKQGAKKHLPDDGIDEGAATTPGATTTIDDYSAWKAGRK